MELLYIFKYKFLIFKHRLQQMRLLYKLLIILAIALIIPAIFEANILTIKVLHVYFEFDSSEYFFVINLINEILMMFMIPYLVKKSYSNNFNLEKDYILYTAPISLKTIFFYKFIMCNNKAALPITIITMPNIIAYGIVDGYSPIQIVSWILTLIILILFVSTIIQLLTVISTVPVKARYRSVFVNIIASVISIMLLVLLLALEKMYGTQDVLAYLKTDNFIKKVFFPFEAWNRLSISIGLGKIDINQLAILLVGCISCIILYFCLYRLMYLKGQFISNTTDAAVKSKNEENIFYILLKRLFKSTYILIYKDILILTRSIEKWGVILRPIIFTPLPFLGVEDFFSYSNISEILVILFVWLSSDLAVYSIRNEGTMLEQIRNSSFNMRNIIYSKITFSSIIATFLYILISILMCLFFDFAFYQVLILDICIVGIIITTSAVRVSCAMLYAKEDNNDEEYSINLSFSGEVLSYVYMLIAAGIVIGISMVSMYIIPLLGSWMPVLICALSTILITIFVYLLLKFCTKVVSERVIS